VPPEVFVNQPKNICYYLLGIGNSPYGLPKTTSLDLNVFPPLVSKLN
jgi:hypothetical protein